MSADKKTYMALRHQVLQHHPVSSKHLNRLFSDPHMFGGPSNPLFKVYETGKAPNKPD
jgi:hypothetical protein